jgi:hypothetical protein
VFKSELVAGHQGMEVEFTSIADYRPGPRLLRKLELQGMRWIS